MPLVRVEVRNEYRLGAPEIYREADSEEPKEILDGVSVAGLVGVLRQLGDLADFAAEVFHGLQEEVALTSSRSCELMGRAQRIEAVLSPLEKVVLAQRSHLHFTYTPGSNWHACIKCGESKFVYSDTPRFILDSYEDCRDPPRLHLLDRFDPSGPGSCLKRYSDPSFFKKASVVAIGEVHGGKGSLDKHGSKIEKSRSWPRNGGVSWIASYFRRSGSMRVPPQTLACYDSASRAGSGERSNLDLRNGSGYVKGDLSPTYSIQPIEDESIEFISPMKMVDCTFQDCNLHYSSIANTCDDISSNLTQNQGDCNSYLVAWDQKAAKFEPDYSHNSSDHHTHLESFPTKLDREALGNCNAVNFETVDQTDVQTCSQALPIFESGDIIFDDFASENDIFMDSHSAVDVEFEFDVNCMRKHDTDHYSNSASPKSPSATFYPTSSMTAKDKTSSVSSANKSLHSGQSAVESCNLHSLQRNGSRGNSNTSGGTIAESASSIASSDLSNGKSQLLVIGDARSSSESQKAAPETSDVSPVLWTNGGLLGLEPSKPPDCSLLNDFSQSPAFKTVSSKYQEYEESYSPFRKICCKLPPADLDVKLGRTGESFHQNNASSTRANSAAAPVTAREHLEKSRSLTFNKKLFYAEDENFMHTSYQNASAFGCWMPSGQTKDPFGSEPPIPSPSSSPPLVQMKISFKPIDGYETSRLKLKFPYGNGNDEIRDIFPSFQLVPEVLPGQENSGSDSDNDTFCRSSSPSLSDGCHSHQPGTNSEQRESGESSPSKDPDLFDLRSFNTLNHSYGEELRNNANSMNLVEPEYSIAPIPPVQWQVIKPHLEGFDYTFDSNDSLSSISQQPEPAPFNHDNATFEQQRKNSDWQRAVNKGKSIDDKEDFLQLIRSKSFNLRPTVKTKPATSSGSPANAHVTVILEKANSIRQAVGSDDTEDEGNWRDT